MHDFIKGVFLLHLKICAIKIINSVEKTPIIYIYCINLCKLCFKTHTKKMQFYRFFRYHFIQGNAVIVYLYIRFLKGARGSAVG